MPAFLALTTGATAAVIAEGGSRDIHMDGVFDGAVAQIEVSSDGGSTWHPAGGADTLAAVGVINLQLKVGHWRINSAGGGGSQAILVRYF